MVRGLPVVSTTAGAVAEAIVDGESGLLVEPDDHVALAAVLERALGDPDLRHRLGTAARASASARFDRAANLPAVSAALAAAGIIPGDAGAR
jgi:glycosyltransferase involved in cell wall biosynthesis